MKYNKVYPNSYIIDLEEKEYKKILLYMKDYIIKNKYDINKDKDKIILLYNLYNYLF
tara:strand:- start:450 stop:620 length:171 start_codon:yes stop_codon:yes gene_type:complete